jgi:hypothetical protein
LVCRLYKTQTAYEEANNTDFPHGFYFIGEPVGNGKRKHSDGATPKAKKRKLGGRLPDPAVLDLNVGGTLFTTTLHTLNREMSLLSQWAVGQESPRYDTEGRLFIDRDPTHFRYILNYLRDQYLVSMPSALHDRLELLHEARFGGLTGFFDLDAFFCCVGTRHSFARLRMSPRLKTLVVPCF